MQNVRPDPVDPEQQKHAGAFFNGDNFSLVDAAAAPLLQRLDWLQELDPEPGLFDGLEKILSWQRQLQQRKSILQSTVSDIRQRYFQYLLHNWPRGWFAGLARKNNTGQ